MAVPYLAPWRLMSAAVFCFPAGNTSQDDNATRGKMGRRIQNPIGVTAHALERYRERAGRTTKEALEARVRWARPDGGRFGIPETETTIALFDAKAIYVCRKHQKDSSRLYVVTVLSRKQRPWSVKNAQPETARRAEALPRQESGVGCGDSIEREGAAV